MDMHKPAPWRNRLLFPPVIKDKRNEPPMNGHLTALKKRVAKLREVGLKACHCIEEFHLRRIHPLGCQEKLAFKYPQLSDPSHKPAEGKSAFFSIHQW
jgi:hypothetical protein